MKTRKWIDFVLLTTVLVSVWSSALAASSIVSAQHFGIELINDSCIDCHSGESAEGELDLEAMLKQTPLVQNLPQWKNIAKRIELGDMPPRDQRELSVAEKKGFQDWFQTTILDFDYRSVRQAGFEATRRLTHIEYRNTIRDLIGVDIANTDRFPADLSGQSGFDNSANTLFLQGSLLEKYAQSAEQVMERVFASHSDEANSDPKQSVLKKARAAILDSQAKTTDGKAKEVIRRFGRRAMRRPMTDREFDAVFQLYSTRIEKGSDFDASIQRALTSILIMPAFLMKTESPVTHSNRAQPIDDYDLASRLSYFFWASMPDEELFALAKEKRLSDPKVLDAQIDRMLENRRSKSLGYVFAAQWLGFDDVGTRRRQDPIDNPWCTQTLMDSMKAESALFFHSLIKNNEPVTQLVDARYTYLNEELAKHYRVGGIDGSQMRRVNLKTTRRGGILTHASVLSVTAFPDRTSPVMRGKWVLDTLLGTPPPEPPPNVSELSEDVLENDDLSFREKIQLHSKNPKCYACHSEMDPIGFSLENFDNFGRWRNRRYGRKIDSQGELPDGVQFDGPVGLRKIIVDSRRDDLTRQLAEKMLTYALGRQLEYFDESAIRGIITATRQDGYRFQTLIKSTITSHPFRFKQLVGKEEN